MIELNRSSSLSGYADIKEARIYYEMAGKGQYLVLMHAGCTDRRMWDGQFSVFAQDYRVLRYDMRGYGNSTLTPDPFSNRDDLYHLLEFLGIQRSHFIACSMGSLAVADFALEHPEKVKSLVLVSPALSGYPYQGQPPQAVLDLITARKTGDVQRAAELQSRIWADGFKRSSDQVNTQVHELVRQMSLDALNNQIDAIRETGFLMEEPLQPPAMDRLEQITVPALAVAGNLDDDTVMAIADLLATRVGARKAIIHGTAHLPNMEKPDEFNQIILEFLRQM
jgi:pimeloyl-ACP methyl ester carboxylesterase